MVEQSAEAQLVCERSSKSALAGQADLRDGRERGTPPNSPKGYHTPSRRQSCMSPTAGSVEGCPRADARSGCA